MASRNLDRLRQALFIVVSTPVKPGAVHRLRLDTIFESRVSEMVVLSNYVVEAYNRGRQLARGDLDAKSLGLGKLFSDAVRDSFDFTSRKPVPGLAYSAIVASVVTGYSEITGRGVLNEAGRLARIVPYSGDADDAANLIEGLESIGMSDYLLHLDNLGVSKRSVKLNKLSVGDVAEKLYEIDTGFAFNVRHFNVVRDVYSAASAASNLLEATLRAFYKIGRIRGLFEEVSDDKILEFFIKLEKKEYKDSYDNDKLLGGTYLGVVFAYLEKPLLLP